MPVTTAHAAGPVGRRVSDRASATVAMEPPANVSQPATSDQVAGWSGGGASFFGGGGGGFGFSVAQAAATTTTAAAAARAVEKRTVEGYCGAGAVASFSTFDDDGR